MRGLIHKPIPGARALLPGVVKNGLTTDQVTRALLNTAHSWFDAKDVTTGAEQTLPNRGTDTTTATIGSGTGVDTNDPVLLPHSGTDYVWFPGASGNYIEGTESADLANPTTYMLAVRVLIPSGGFTAETRFTGGRSTHRRLIATASNRLLLSLRDNVNGVYMGSESSVDLPTAEGIYWIRGTMTLATGLTTYEYSTDDAESMEDVTSWTQLGAVVGSSPGAGWALSATAQRLIGAISTGGSGGGAVSIYAVEWEQNGSSIFSWLPSSSDPVVRSASGLTPEKVTRPVIVGDGVDDYIDTGYTPSFTTTTGEITAIVAYRAPWNAPTGFDAVLGNAGSSAEGGFRLRTNNGDRTHEVLTVGSLTNTAQDSSGTPSAGEILWAAIRIEDGVLSVGDRFGFAVNNSGMNDDGTYSNTETVKLLAAGDGLTTNLAASAYAIAIFESALTDAQIQSIGEYLLAGSYS